MLHAVCAITVFSSTLNLKGSISPYLIKKKYSKGHCCPLIQRSQQEKELQQWVSATSSRLSSQTSVPLATSKSELSCTAWHGVFWVWAVESHLESGEHVIPMCNLTVRNTWLTSSPTVYRLLTANGSGFCVFVFQIANHTFLMSRHKKDLWGHLSRSWGNRPHSAFRFLLCLFVVFLNPGLWYCTAFQWQWFCCIRMH